MNGLNVTLDNNCIVALSKNEPSAKAVRKLVQYHDAGRINLRLLAINASELQTDGTHLSSFTDFQQRIADLGLGHLEILKPHLYLGISFLGWGMLASEETVELERKIHGILFPKVEFEYIDYCRKRGLDADSKDLERRWLSKKCDVSAMWCHIFYKGDAFVTTDRNFHKKTKKQALIQFGAGDILTPEDAVAKCASEEAINP
jgi:hypothetical protein